MRTTPCKDCPTRHEGCHTDCEPYRAWAAAFRSGRETNMADSVLAQHRMQRKAKWERGKR